MSHTTKIVDMDPLFRIDPITRAITKESASDKTTVVQYDHNSEKFTFSLPRYVEGHDMAECNRVEVHYLTTSGNIGIYEVKDFGVYSEDESLVICTWLLSQNATADTGELSFLVRFACVTEDGTVEYAWNTGIYAGISVQRGLYNAEAIEERNADIIAQWKAELFTDSEAGVTAVESEAEKAVVAINVATNGAIGDIQTAGYNELENIVTTANAKKEEILTSIPEDYATLNADVQESKSLAKSACIATDITNIKEVQWEEGYHYISSTGVYTERAETASSACKLTLPIRVNKGDVIKATVKTATGRAVIAYTNEEQSYYEPLIIGDNVLKEHTYTMTKDGYVVINCRSTIIESSSKIEIVGTKSGELSRFENELTKIKTPNYYSVKSGGSLKALETGKPNLSLEMVVSVDGGESRWFYGSSTRQLACYIDTDGRIALNTNAGNSEKVWFDYNMGEVVHIVFTHESTANVQKVYANGIKIGEKSGVTTSFLDSFTNGGADITLYQKRFWNRVLTDDEVARLYNNGFPTKYKLNENISNGLISNLIAPNILTEGWYDDVQNITVSFSDTVELAETDIFNEYNYIKKHNEKIKALESVITKNIYPDFSVVAKARGCHDCTFIGDYLVSFNKPSDGYTSFLNATTLERENRKVIRFTEPHSSRELELKSCDYKYGKLLVGNGRAIKYDETSYLEQGSKLYVFYNAENWINTDGEITFDNCGTYDIIDISGLGYKVYGFWGQFDDCIFISCNLFNDIYLIQLGKGAVNLGQGTYVEGVTDDRYNGSYTVIKRWHQGGALGDWAGHGGQYYKGHLYIATNETPLCTVYKCVLNDNGSLQFEALNFNVMEGEQLKYRYIDGICIKDDKLYAQPLNVGSTNETNGSIIILSEL